MICSGSRVCVSASSMTYVSNFENVTHEPRVSWCLRRCACACDRDERTWTISHYFCSVQDTRPCPHNPAARAHARPTPGAQAHTPLRAHATWEQANGGGQHGQPPPLRASCAQQQGAAEQEVAELAPRRLRRPPALLHGERDEDRLERAPAGAGTRGNGGSAVSPPRVKRSTSGGAAAAAAAREGNRAGGQQG